MPPLPNPGLGDTQIAVLRLVVGTEGLVLPRTFGRRPTEYPAAGALFQGGYGRRMVLMRVGHQNLINHATGHLQNPLDMRLVGGPWINHREAIMAP